MDASAEVEVVTAVFGRTDDGCAIDFIIDIFGGREAAGN